MGDPYAEGWATDRLDTFRARYLRRDPAVTLDPSDMMVPPQPCNLHGRRALKLTWYELMYCGEEDGEPATDEWFEARCEGKLRCTCGLVDTCQYEVSHAAHWDETPTCPECGRHWITTQEGHHDD